MDNGGSVRRRDPVDEVRPILLAGSIGLSDRDLVHLINAALFTGGIASIIQSGRDDHAEFEALSRAYRDRFGIPLIRCVGDAGRPGRILAQGWRRLTNSPAQEHSAARVEVVPRRFDEQIVDANPIQSARRWALHRGDE